MREKGNRLWNMELPFLIDSPQLEKSLNKILKLINEERDESLTTDEERQAVLDFTRLIGIGKCWLELPEKTKEQLRKFRKLLNKACEYRNSFYVPDSIEGHAIISRPLDYLMLLPDFGGVGVDPLAEIVRACGDLLGDTESALFPRRKIIEDVLALWIRYTGKPPQKYAIQPSSYSKSKEVPPYALCRIVLTVIEDCNDTGDFSTLYESAVRSLSRK